MKYFPLYKQLDAMDCGPTCLRMVVKYYGRSISLDHLRNKSQYGKQEHLFLKFAIRGGYDFEIG